MGSNVRIIQMTVCDALLKDLFSGDCNKKHRFRVSTEYRYQKNLSKDYDDIHNEQHVKDYQRRFEQDSG